MPVKTKPSIEVERITPTIAKHWLEECNTHNRKLRVGVVDRYSRDIKDGNWKLTGEPIQFNSEGVLLNGQHRLSAVVKAKKPIEVVVMRGIDPGAMAFIDTGAKRTFADWLRLNGHSNVNNLASAVRACHRYEQGWMRLQESGSQGELIDWLEKNPEIVNTVARFVGNHRNRILFNGQAYCLLDHFTSKDLPGEFSAYAAIVVNDSTPPEGTPAFVYRKYMESHRLMTGRRVQPLMLQAIAIKAWNAHIEGRAIKTLRWKAGGVFAEDFPTIVTAMP